MITNFKILLYAFLYIIVELYLGAFFMNNSLHTIISIIIIIFLAYKVYKTFNNQKLNYDRLVFEKKKAELNSLELSEKYKLERDTKDQLLSIIKSNNDENNPDGLKYKIFNLKKHKINFDSIAGLKEVKEELYEIIDFLKNPKKYHDMGAKIPRGILFQGPPGTGKTLLAKAVAGEAGVKFIYTSGSEFIERLVGVGASRVRALFKEANKNKMPCIIFIDEIDAIGARRDGLGNDSEKDKTLNQLLVEMDGFDEKSNIVIIAATNRKDILDSALLRPGRFDRQIYIGLPTQEERKEIIRVHSRNKKLSQDFDIDSLARKTISFSGAQLAGVLNEATLLAIRNNKTYITNNFAEESIDRVLMGPAKKTRQYIQKEKNIVAYHEAGHAVVGLKLDNAKTVEKITIIPRGEAGGYNLFSEKEERFFHTKNSILNEIKVLLAGRAAEEIIFNDVTNGASNDLEKATHLATKYVCEFGMSDLGLMSMTDNRNISSATNEKIDLEINKIINQCYQQSIHILNQNKDLLIAIANNLLEKEVIDAKDIQKIAYSY